jgi:hypothetical protein
VRVADLAERSDQFGIVVLPSDVVLLDAFFASAQKAAILLRTPRQPPGRIEGILVHHDEDSGKA